jgi:hypothetical protein
MPEVTAGLMGISTDAQGYAALQFMGLCFLVTCAFVFSYRNVPHSTDRQIVFLALFLSYLGMIALHITYHSLSNMVVMFAIAVEAILTILYFVLFIMNMRNQ